MVRLFLPILLPQKLTTDRLRMVCRFRFANELYPRSRQDADPAAFDSCFKIMLDNLFGKPNSPNKATGKQSKAHPLSLQQFEAIADALLYYIRNTKKLVSNRTLSRSANNQRA